MADTPLIKKIRTSQGDVSIDYNALVNKPESATEKKSGLVKAKAKTDADTVEVKIGSNGMLYVPTYPDVLLSGIENYYALRRTGKVYQTKLWKFAKNPASAGEKLLDNAGLEFTPATDTDAGQDSYENIPMFEWRYVNYKRYPDGTPYPIALEGTSGYSETGLVDVGAMQMSFYYNWDASNAEYDLITVSDTPHPELGLKPWPECVRADGTVLPWCIGSAYVSGTASDGMLRSQPGLKPARDQSHNKLIVNYAKKGAGYFGAGAVHNLFQIVMIAIKCATKNSQSVFGGCTNYSFQYEASVQSADKHTYFPLSNANAANLLVGSYVSVGHGILKDDGTIDADRARPDIHAYADDVKIKAITTLDKNNKKVELDIPSGSAFATTPVALNDTVNAPILLSCMHWWSGSTKKVLGHHDGSPGSLTDNKHPYRIQGREYAVGGCTIASDVVLDSQTDYTKKVYVAEKGTAHSNNEATIKSTYKDCGTIPTSGENKDFWVGDIGVDVATGAWYPKTVGASDSQGFADHVYPGSTNASVREYLQGGALGLGAHAGSAFLNCRGGLGGSSWDFLGRD